MMNFVKLNKAAVTNLLDGALPPFAVVSPDGAGFRISPYKIKRGTALPVVDGRFPIPESFISGTKQALAVRLDDKGDLIVYPTSAERKSSLPSAKIMKGQIKEIVVEETPAIDPEPTVEATVEPTIEKLPSMLIKASEVAIEPLPAPKPIVESSDAALEAKLMQDWKAPVRPRPRSDIANFALTPEPRTLLGMRRETGRTISVPISFNSRREMGQRAVEVVVKRRRHS
jgi:hypothetical protein